MAITLEQAEAFSANGHPLRATVDRWLRLIKAAEQDKYSEFGKWAEEAEKFYDGNHDWMWKEEYARNADTGGFLSESNNDAMPTFRMSVNRAFEAVALFGPALYHQNPNVRVSTHQHPEITPEVLGIGPELGAYGPQIEESLRMQEQQRMGQLRSHASIMEVYLNWLQQEGDKKVQARRAINEAIIKGMSLLWTELYQPPGSSVQYPRSIYCSVDDLVIDPDASYWEDVQWIARRCVHPVNLVEEKYGLPPGSIHGQMRSRRSQSTNARPRGPTGTTLQQTGLSGKSFDLIEYWEVYSKNGFGDKLKIDKEEKVGNFDFTPLGQFTYCVVAEGVPYPLNMPTWDLVSKPDQELFEQAQWPIPYWADPNCDGGWPFSRIYFYEKPNSVWPMSLFKPCISELRFVNWCMSFLADKAAQACTTYVGMLKEAGAEIQKQLQGRQTPFTILEIGSVTGINKLSDAVDFVQAPSFPIDIWRMVSEVMTMIDKRTGLTELQYGLTSTQIRSAREADIKEGATNIRPEDMASKTEDFLSATAAKEMQCARWHLNSDHVRHVVGESAGYIWDQQLLTEDYDVLVRDFQFRIEAGSARKPNKNARAQKLNEFGQLVLPFFQQMAMSGQIGPLNAYIRDQAKMLDIDPEPYMIQPPQPQEPQEQGPSDEQIKQQEKVMKLQFDAASHEQELNQDAINHEQELEQADEKHDMEVIHKEEKHAIELSNLRNRGSVPASSFAGRNGELR